MIALSVVALVALAFPAHAAKEKHKMTGPKVGSPAPAFTAKDQDGKTISLADFHGKQNVVLYFYPADETGGCSFEACRFRDDMSKYQSASTVVLGVSTQDANSHKHFVEKEKLNFSLLDDASETICTAYGVLDDEPGEKYADRQTFLIDKQGIIRKHDGDFTKETLMAHSSDLLKAIAALK